MTMTMPKMPRRSCRPPDKSAMKGQVQGLFGRCAREYPGGLCEIRWLHLIANAGARTRLFPTDAQELADAANDAAEMNGAGYKVYVGVDPAGAPREIVRRPSSMSISP
jgi:hypothetical protein